MMPIFLRGAHPPKKFMQRRSFTKIVGRANALMMVKWSVSGLSFPYTLGRKIFFNLGRAAVTPFCQRKLRQCSYVQ
jgi:hypothetical protein